MKQRLQLGTLVEYRQRCEVARGEGEGWKKTVCLVVGTWSWALDRGLTDRVMHFHGDTQDPSNSPRGYLLLPSGQQAGYSFAFFGDDEIGRLRVLAN